MPSEGFGGGGRPEKRFKRALKKKAQSCIVAPLEERGVLNQREGENWRRKGLTMSPNGIKLSRNSFIYSLRMCVCMIAGLDSDWSQSQIPKTFMWQDRVRLLSCSSYRGDYMLTVINFELNWIPKLAWTCVKLCLFFITFYYVDLFGLIKCFQNLHII